MLLPDISEKSIYDIDYKKLKETGVTLLVFDLDNTLTNIRGKDVTKQLKLITDLKEMGFKCIIVSNNIIKRRVAHWGTSLGIDFKYAAFKPRLGVYKKVLKKYRIPSSRLACIGDQLLTDVIGANRIGATSILINPVKEKDEVLTRVSRSIESLIIKHYQKKDIKIRKY